MYTLEGVSSVAKINTAHCLFTEASQLNRDSNFLSVMCFLFL